MSIIKKVVVTFDFDSETDSVKNVECFVDGIEKKKKTTTSKKKKEEVVESNAIITLESNKLIFNNKALADLKADVGDRIVIKYEKAKNGEDYPIIGKDLDFDEEGTGNKLTKSGSISYRGQANTILAVYGSEFSLEPIKEGIWKLTSDYQPQQESNDELENFKKISFELEEPDMITEGDDEFEIDAMTFQL